MSAIYIKDDAGIVHVQSPDSGGEFTFCNRPLDGDDECEGFFPEPASWPSDCPACVAAIQEFREAIRGVKFTRAARETFHGD